MRAIWATNGLYSRGVVESEAYSAPARASKVVKVGLSSTCFTPPGSELAAKRRMCALPSPESPGYDKGHLARGTPEHMTEKSMSMGIKEMMDAANAQVPRITPQEAQTMMAK